MSAYYAMPSLADHARSTETLRAEQCAGLLAHLSRVPDPRGSRGLRHGLLFLLGTAAAAVLAGAKSFVEIAEWAGDASQHVLAALGARCTDGRYRAPSESTLRRVLQTTDPVALDAAVSGWLNEQVDARDDVPDEHPRRAAGRRAVALDGKTVRGARVHSDPHSRAPHLVAAFDHDHGVVRAQHAVDVKSNEITAVRPLLADLNLVDQVVSADAMHTQRDLAQWLVDDKNAHYLFVIKDNQPTLLTQAIAATTGTDDAFTDATHVSTNRGHGRTEKRTVRVAPATGVEFPHAAQILRIRRDRGDLDGVRISKEIVYAVTDLNANQASPTQLATYARGHWSIENKLHHVRDVTYREDASQIRSGTGPRIMATLRNLAISTLRLAGRNENAKALRHNNRDANRPLAMLGITIQT